LSFNDLSPYPVQKGGEILPDILNALHSLIIAENPIPQCINACAPDASNVIAENHFTQILQKFLSNMLAASKPQYPTNPQDLETNLPNPTMQTLDPMYIPSDFITPSNDEKNRPILPDDTENQKDESKAKAFIQPSIVSTDQPIVVPDDKSLTSVIAPPVQNQISMLVLATLSTLMQTKENPPVNPTPAELKNPNANMSELITAPESHEVDNVVAPSNINVQKDSGESSPANSSQATNVQTSEPSVTVEIEANQRAGPIKIPYFAPNPFVSNEPDDMSRDEAAAGPRTRPSNSMESKGEGKTPLNLEEAAKQEIQREVFRTQSRPVDWLNNVFRKPVNELTRDGFRFPERFTNPPVAQPVNTDIKPDRMPPESVPIKSSVILEKPILQNGSVIPEIDAKIEIIQSSIKTSAQNNVPISSSESEPPDSDSKPKLNAKIKAEVLARTPKSADSKSHVDYTNAPAKPVKGNELYKPVDLQQVMPIAKSTRFMTPVKSSSQMESQESLKDGTNAIAGVSQMGKMSEGVIESSKPMHVLDDIPSRIASDIKRLESADNIDKNLTTLRVQLKPPRLGPLEIEISRSENGLDVKLITRTIFAKELITQRGDEIRQALENNGLHLRKFEISHTMPNQNQHEQIGSFTNSHGTHYGGNRQESPEQSQFILRDEDLIEEIESEFASSKPDNPREHQVLDIVV